MEILKENQFFIYALIVHISFMLFLKGAEEILSFEIDSQNKTISQLNITSFETLPFQENKVPENNVSETGLNNKRNVQDDIEEKLDSIEDRALSYVVEPQNKNQSKNGSKENENIQNKIERFDASYEQSKENTKAIFKRREELKKIQETYQKIQDQEHEVQLKSGTSVNEDELIKSKGLLLSYENYQKSLHQKVLDNWVYPENTDDLGECRVKVRQNTKGEVQSMSYKSCVDDESFRRSVKLAIYRSSPLKLPDNEKIYNEFIYFNFKANY